MVYAQAMQVREVIAAYEQAIAADDRAVARDWLEKLEGEAYRNEADWALIREFLQKEGLSGRLEMITSALIRKGGLTTGQPYFVLAGIYIKARRLEQAKPLIAQYKRFQDEPVAGWDQKRWEFVNLLYEAHLYSDCLVELNSMLQTSPAEFNYLILEAKTQAKLKNFALAVKKLTALKPALGTDAGRWQSYAWTAFEFGELALGQAATETLIKLIERGDGKLNWTAVQLMKRNGFGEALNSLVFAADPKYYRGHMELTYVFDLALEFGAGKTATSFAHALLALDLDKKLRARVEQFLAAPRFLMA